MIHPAPPGPQRPRPLLRTILGEVLRDARRSQGRTLADVARSARVSLPYLSEVERGRKEASSEVLAAICDALGLELPDLLAEVRSGLVAARGRRAVLALRERRVGFGPPGEVDRPAPGQPAGPADAARAVTGPPPGDVVCRLAA